MLPTQSTAVKLRSGLSFYCFWQGIRHNLHIVGVSNASKFRKLLVFIFIVQQCQKFRFCSLYNPRNTIGVSPVISFNFSQLIISFCPSSSVILIRAFLSDSSYVVAFPVSPFRPTSISLFRLVAKSPQTPFSSFLTWLLQLSPSVPR